jgi:hypothetical protein
MVQARTEHNAGAFFASVHESLSTMFLMPMLDGLSFMGAWTAGVMGGESVSGGGDRRDLDEEESIEVGTIEPGVDVGTDDPNFTGLVAAGVVPPPILRPTPMLKASLKVRWERLLMPEEMKCDDGGRIREADVNGDQGISSPPIGSGRWE